MAYLAVGQQWSAVVSDRASDRSSSPDLPVSAFSVMCKLSQPVSLIATAEGIRSRATRIQSILKKLLTLSAAPTVKISIFISLPGSAAECFDIPLMKGSMCCSSPSPSSHSHRFLDAS